MNLTLLTIDNIVKISKIKKKHGNKYNGDTQKT